MSKNRKRFSCGHRGFGAFCHRCQFIEKLEQMVEAGKQLVGHHGENRKYKWSLTSMREEIKRLQKNGRGQ